ncbi:MAG: hypothetical protein KKH02_04115, partial [Proteobacteria bacterium]|nr:hypothetical protein [Pseudomonadota bacterium]MBU4581589.1 hypothetical protein [Pseudomonadota bacterium]MCG2742206.1 hypothetical protein [Syntrophaceae bacterium]
MALTIKRNLLLNDPTGGRGRLVSQPGVIINKKSFSRKRFFSSRKWTNRTQFLFSKSNFDELVKSLKSPPPSRGRVRVGVISDCISGCNFPLPLIPSRKGRGKLT